MVNDQRYLIMKYLINQFISLGRQVLEKNNCSKSFEINVLNNKTETVQLQQNMMKYI